jgi:hypothetical protein
MIVLAGLRVPGPGGWPVSVTEHDGQPACLMPKSPQVGMPSMFLPGDKDNS